MIGLAEWEKKQMFTDTYIASPQQHYCVCTLTYYTSLDYVQIHLFFWDSLPFPTHTKYIAYHINFVIATNYLQFLLKTIRSYILYVHKYIFQHFFIFCVSPGNWNAPNRLVQKGLARTEEEEKKTFFLIFDDDLLSELSLVFSTSL